MKISKKFLLIISIIPQCLFSQKLDQTAHPLRSAEIEAITEFINYEISKPEYLEEVLPNDFTHIIQLIGYGHTLHGNRLIYGRSVFTIFNKLIGGVHFVNPYPFAATLENLSRLLKPYVVTFKSTSGHTGILVDLDLFGRLKKAVDDMFFLEFSTRFDAFKSDPEQFFDNLSEQIIQAAREEIDAERFRQAMVRFIEIGMTKLIWDINDPKSIWPNIKNISATLQEFYTQGIIEDINDLDNLYWALIHRFNYFMDITYERMPSSFYEEIKADIATDIPALLSLEEQDMCLQTKADCFKYALLKNEARSLAYSAHGILSSGTY